MSDEQGDADFEASLANLSNSADEGTPRRADGDDAGAEGGSAGLHEEMQHLRADLADALDRMHETLLDVASGEVVGALWDEFRGFRDRLEELAEGMRSDGGPGAGGPSEGASRTTAEIRALSADLNTAVSEIRDVAAAVDELGGLRAELGAGLVVEPSEDLTTALDSLHGEIGSLQERLESLSAIRESIDAVQAQLAEGLVLADDVELPAPPAAGGDGEAHGPALADQIASLRDHLSTELDGIRALVSQSAASQSAAPAPEPEHEVQATLDPDTVDLLRDEIRAAGEVPDQVLDALRQELKALRRRLAVKAQEKVLSDEQLELIADAVAERLKQDRGD